MKKFELMVEGYHTPLTAAQVAGLFQARRVRRNDPCREVGKQNWRTVDELFPLLKYDSGSRAPALPLARTSSILDGPDQSREAPRAMTSALKAGWICFGIGLLLSWFFPLANAFFSIAVITAIVAMCTHQVNRGLALLLSSFFAIGLCALIFFTLVIGTIGAAAGAAIKKSNADMRRIQQTQAQRSQQLNNATAQLQTTLRTSSNQISLPTFSSTAPARVHNSSSEQQRQYEVAMQRQREADAQKAADEKQRARNVYEAERQRDSAKAKEQRLQQVQNSIDWWDKAIRQAREQNVNTKVYEDQRDGLLKEKTKLQGY